MKTLTIYSTNALQKVQKSHFLAKSNTHIRQCIHQRAIGEQKVYAMYVIKYMDQI